MGKVTGEGAINFKAGMDLTEVYKSRDELNKIFKDSKISPSGAFDTKPLTEYQAGLLKIKQESLEFAKAKAEQARADKAASLATQAALREEAGLRREALAAKAPSGKRFTEFSNSQSEIDAYNKSAQASTIYTSAINAQVVARARDTQQAAVQAVSEGTLRAEQMSATKAVQDDTIATRANNLTKEQAAKLLLEEKYLQAQRTKELKNSIREELNAKGSLEQRRAALIRLQTAYDRLSTSERATPAGQRLEGIVARTTEQVKGLEAATGRAQRNVGNYSNAFIKGLSGTWTWLSKIAQIIPGLGIGGIFLAGFSALGLLVDRLGIFKSSLEKLNPSQLALNSSRQESAGLIAKESAETTLLISKIKDTGRSMTERQSLLNDFISKNPAVLGALNLQNIATEKGTAVINDYIDALRRKIEMQSLEKGYAEALEKRADIDSGKEDTGLGWLGKSLITANKVLAGFKGESITEAIDKANARFKNQALIAQDSVIKGYEERIKATVTGEAKIKKVQDTSLAAAEARLSKVNERLRTLQKGESDKTLKQQKAQLEKEIKQRTAALGLDTNTSAGKAEAKAQESALKRQRTLQAEIDALTKQGVASKLDADQQEIVSVENKYKKLREKAIAFNNAKDSKGQKVNVSGLNAAESAEKLEIKQKTEAKVFGKSLDEQAKYYAEYEDLKTKIGEEKAKERYAKLIDTDKTYLEHLQDQQDQMTNPNHAKGGDETQANPFAMKLLAEEMAAQAIVQQKADDERYARALQAAMTHSQALAAIDREYNDNAKALGKDATDEQIANLNRQKAEAIRNANETNAYLKSGYDELLQNFDAMTRKQIVDRLEAIKAGYRKEYEEGKLTAEQLANLVGQVDGNLDNLNGDNSFKKVTSAIKNYRDQIKALGKDSEGAKEAQKGMYGAIAKVAGDINEIVGEIASSLDELGIGGEQTQKTFKDIMGVVDGAGKIGKGLATGNPVDIITGSIKLLTSAISLFNNKDVKLQKQIDTYKAQLDGLSKSYAALDRAVNNSVGESFYTDSEKQIDNLREQQRALIAMRDAEAKKKKSDAGKIAEYNAQIDEIPNKIEDIRKAISENLIQTNFKDLSNNLADALAEAFASGEDSAKGFDDVFRGVISNAIKNSLKLKILDPIIKKFTDDLTAYAKNNGNSVIGFDFNAYKDQLKAAGDLFSAGLKGSEEYFKSVGLDAGTVANTDSTLTKNIKGITSDQASALEGITRGTYDLTKQVVANTSLLNPISKTLGDLYQIASGNLAYNAEIAANTANTVQRLDMAIVELKGINKNTVPTNIRGGGLG